MLPQRTSERLSGVLLLGLLGAIVATVALGSTDVSAAHFPQEFQELVENQGRYWANVIVLHGAKVLVLALAVTAYLAFRPYGQALALMGSVGLVALAVALAVANIGGAILAGFADEYETASVVKADAIVSNARTIALLSFLAWFDGLFTFLPMTLLALGVLIVRSGALPRGLGWLAVVASVVMPSIWLIQDPLYIDAFWVVGMIAGMAAMAWLLIVGVWLLVVGTRKGAMVPAEGAGQRSISGQPLLESGPA